MSHKVFISYSTKDKQTADAICHVLEQNNLKCWIAPRNITSGRHYASEIVDGIREAKIIVLVFSKNSQESKYVRNEIDNAFSNNKPILSFKIDETIPKDDMEYYLKINHWLDAHPEPEKEFKTLIRDALKLCNEESEKPISWSLKDFVPQDMSKLKKDYTSLVLLFTPFYWASFIYMGISSDMNIWKLSGLLYLIPTIVCIIFYFQIWGYLFIFYGIFTLFAYLFLIFWALAIVHGLLIRNEFLTRKSVLRVMSSDDEMFQDLLDEYSQI